MYLNKEELEKCIDQDNYFGYDTGDSTTYENGKFCDELRSDLRELGYVLEDPYIEHDYISGYVVKIENDPPETVT